MAPAPFALLFLLLIGLLSTVLIGGSGYVFYQYWQGEPIAVGILIAASIAATAALLGRYLALLCLTRNTPEQQEDPTIQRILLTGSDGTRLHVESSGPEDGIPIVLTHGWSADLSHWQYARRALSGKFRVVTWDLRGVGNSSAAGDQGYSIDAMASDLALLIKKIDDPRTIVVGHSMGGMIIQQLVRNSPAALQNLCAGLVLVHTTYCNPVRTAWGRSLAVPLQGPVLVPIAYTTWAFAPLVWIQSWLAFLNGTLHLNSVLIGFGTVPSSYRLDQQAAMSARCNPAVLARQMLGMFEFDAEGALIDCRLPILIISGEEDIVTQPDGSEHIANTAPTASLVRLPNTGHLGLVEQSDAISSRVEKFALASRVGMYEPKVGSTAG